MALASKLTEIGIIAISFAIGFISIYLLSDLSNKQKRKHIEELISQLINFVIFIWLGKISLNLFVFISDPLSILAYPSDSKAFYFAIVSITLVLLYKSKRKKMNVLPLIESFVHLFLISSFVYEFIQFIVEENTYSFGYIVLLAALIGLFTLLRARMSFMRLLIVMVTTWSIGMMILAIVQPFVTVFGYMMEPWFVGMFFVISISRLTYKIRKRDA